MSINIVSVYHTVSLSRKSGLQILSNIKSFNERQVTLLAIIETLIAISITALISIYLDTYIHIVISASLAPFLLLKTEKSTHQTIHYFTALSLKLAGTLTKCIDFEKTRNTFLLGIPLLVVLGLCLLAIKIYVVFINLVTSPLDTVRAIPENWYSVAFCLDSKHPPEPIPGWESCRVEVFEKHDLEDPNISWFDINDFNHREPVEFTISVMLWLIFFLPSFIYRYSLKSTSIIYMPFIWLVNLESKGSAEARNTIEYFYRSQIEKLKRIYAWFVLSFLTAFPLYMLFIQSSVMHELSSKTLAIYFIPVVQVDSWHITRSLSAFLTLVLFYYSDFLRLQLKERNNNLLLQGEFALGIMQKLRLTFGLWTIICGLYLVYSTVEWSKFPSIRWLPV